MHVAIVIVGFRNADDIAHCLRAVARSEYADFEVVICENGGAAAFATLTARIPRRLAGGQPVTAILAPTNLGYAGGVNHGMNARPQADCWWVLNPDTEPEPGALGTCLERLSRGDCNAVGCTVALPGGIVQSHGGRWWPWLARAESIGHGTRLSSPVNGARVEAVQTYLNGACMLVDQKFLRTVGPMREDYFLYCEEVEWFLRARARGLNLGFAPGAVVLHAGGTTTGSYEDVRRRPRMPIYLGERNKILLTRDCTPTRLPVALLGAMVVGLRRYGLRRAWPQLGYAVSGWLAGLRNERGPAGFGS